MLIALAVALVVLASWVLPIGCAFIFVYATFGRIETELAELRGRILATNVTLREVQRMVEGLQQTVNRMERETLCAQGATRPIRRDHA